MEKKTSITIISKILIWIQRIFLLVYILIVMVTTIKRGIESGNTSTFIYYLLIGIVSSIIIILIYLCLLIWNKSVDWLSIQMGKYIKIRRRIIILFSIFAMIITFTLVIYSQMNDLLRLSIGIYFLLIVPSAIISLLQEERMREQFSLIGGNIPVDLIMQTPQAAIEYGFTMFEDRLRKRIEKGSEYYGERLINIAYGNDGKLSYDTSEVEQNGVRNFISGAYSILRNPRKHRIITDDKLRTLEILSVIELLIRIVDESVDKSQNNKAAAQPEVASHP